MSERKTFQIRLNDQDRWFVEKVFTDKGQAERCCQDFVEDDSCEYEGVQIVQIWKRANGEETEKVLREERLVQKRAPLRLAAIEEAAACSNRADYLGLEARITMSRILRFYLEREGLIPSELLYSHDKAKCFMACDLSGSAIDRVSTLQSKQGDIDSRQRRDDIFLEIQSIMDDVLKIQKTKEYKTFDSDDLSIILETVAKIDKPMAFNVFLCKALIQLPNIDEKITVILDWLESETGKKLETELDSILAEIMASATLVQDMLGPQRNLAAAITTLLDWFDGKECIGNGASPKAVNAICRLFSQDRLEATRNILFDFILRQLAGKQPLSRNDLENEEKEFMTLFARLALPSGMIGGANMAEALSRRYGRSLKQGGESGERMSIKWLLELLPYGASRLPYLLALCDAPLGKIHPDVVHQSLMMLCNNATSINDFCDDKLSMKARLVCMKDLHILVEESGLKETDIKDILRTLDRLVEKYLIDSKLIDKLDNPNATLRDRAIRMVQFCGSGVLWEHGHAMSLARQRVVDHLKGVGFVEKFTAEEDEPAKKEVMIRDFYKLLAEAGFKA